jgi:hypothetical protein
MLTFGIDVALLMFVMVACITVSFIVSLAMPLDHDSGWACIIATTITSVVMVVGYIVIAAILDSFM